ncbi:YdeI family protein [Naasia sp. SYSU D00948]|uniref:YdeI/OmpD-associated family protein n=1 Tax=Naasia sp. SYSU D00948 TaxID=2817379 RepID=UPI001B3095A6|nr:YdeI/OmpD-associated family protein [Naasia sp. SYSU D00948]
MSRPEEAPRVHFERPEEWRAWLLAHAESESSVWLVSWRRETGRPAIAYEDAVLHALSVGWVDSTQKRVDDERTMLYFARRKPRSGWSRPNKIRVERLRREGLMTAAGERAIEEAIRNGAWGMLDDVEDLVVPDDLTQAFERHPGAREHWDAFPRSARRAILEWVAQAKRPDTRERRVEETAHLAAEGRRANQWPPEGRGATGDGSAAQPG